MRVGRKKTIKGGKSWRGKEKGTQCQVIMLRNFPKGQRGKKNFNGEVNGDLGRKGIVSEGNNNALKVQRETPTT